MLVVWAVIKIEEHNQRTYEHFCNLSGAKVYVLKGEAHDAKSIEVYEAIFACYYARMLQTSLSLKETTAAYVMDGQRVMAYILIKRNG